MWCTQVARNDLVERVGVRKMRDTYPYEGETDYESCDTSSKIHLLTGFAGVKASTEQAAKLPEGNASHPTMLLVK